MRRAALVLAAAALAATVCPAAETEGRELLRRADELWRGAGGTYDPEAAEELFEQAAATGDPAASFRLALILDLRKPRRPGDAGRARELHERSAAAVERLASQGDSYAQYLIGTAALSPLFGTDYRTARLWLELAAEAGEVWAVHNLAWMKDEGHGFPAQDKQGALLLYRRAAEAGNVASMYDLGIHGIYELPSRENCRDGMEWLERAAKAGHVPAAFYLGKLLLYGREGCVHAAPDQAPRWLRLAAAADEPGARYDLAIALLSRAASAEERARAVALLERDAERPDRLTAETLALLYASGTYVARDPVRARELIAAAARLGSDGLRTLSQETRAEPFTGLMAEGVRRLEKLADDGDVPASALLSHLYFFGSGVRRDLERAVGLAQTAAAGEASAMRILASAYLNGLGAARDPAAGLRWLSLGAEAGDSFCMMLYSQRLMKGDGIERDLQRGLVWLTRSAEAGNWWAVKDLGNLHDEGWYGLPRNPHQAARWKRHLAELGDEEAKGWLAYHGYAAP